MRSEGLLQETEQRVCEDRVDKKVRNPHVLSGHYAVKALPLKGEKRPRQKVLQRKSHRLVKEDTDCPSLTNASFL